MEEKIPNSRSRRRRKRRRKHFPYGETAAEMYEKGLCLEKYLAERQAEQWAA